MRLKYQKPKIRSKKIMLNQFFQNRLMDSRSVFDRLDLLAAGVGSGGCSSSGTCFLAGTKILMADGTTKSIEEIKKGDIVTSFTIKENKPTQSTVQDLILHEKSHNGYLIINNVLKVTPEHLVFINNAWKAAESITEGDKLVGSDGKDIKVQSVDYIAGEVKSVYNIHLNGQEHNFFAEGIFVHNFKICLSSSTKIAAPFGSINVKNIKIGQLVWTLDKSGKKVAAPVIKISKTAVPKTHQVTHLILEDGRELLVSPHHPIINQKEVYQLKKGQKYDDSIITDIKLVHYKYKYTYDLLPAGDTGYYWANYILMGSTLSYSSQQEKVLKAKALFPRFYSY